MTVLMHDCCDDCDALYYVIHDCHFFPDTEAWLLAFHKHGLEVLLPGK